MPKILRAFLAAAALGLAAAASAAPGLPGGGRPQQLLLLHRRDPRRRRRPSSSISPAPLQRLHPHRHGGRWWACSPTSSSTARLRAASPRAARWCRALHRRLQVPARAPQDPDRVEGRHAGGRLGGAPARRGARSRRSGRDARSGLGQPAAPARRAGGRICDTTVMVYDGSRVSRLKVAAPGEKDGRLVCDGAYARFKGEASSMVGAREFPFSITFGRTATAWPRWSESRRRPISARPSSRAWTEAARAGLSLGKTVREADVTDFARTRALFELPEGVVYLDGNSLGPLPKAAVAGGEPDHDRGMGQELIRAWNSRGWIGKPRGLGDRIGRLIGAPEGTRGRRRHAVDQGLPGARRGARAAARAAGHPVGQRQLPDRPLHGAGARRAARQGPRSAPRRPRRSRPRSARTSPW